MAEPRDYQDLPLDDYVALMEQMIHAGWTDFTKFTCLHCGSRQTGEEPNTVCTGGYSCEACGQTSFPKKFGCVIAKTIPETTHAPEEYPS